MADLYVKLDGKTVLEACPDKIEGGKKVSATEQQIDEIMRLRYSAESDGVKITSTSLGRDAEAVEEAIVTQEAEAAKAIEESK